MKKWFHNLKVSQKLMLISVFFVMPDSLMLYFFITGINANIQFAQLEKKGNEYQRPLETLLHLIPLHRQLADRVSNGEQTAVQELSKKEAEIESAFDALEKVDARIGCELQFTDEGLAKRKREHYRVCTVRKEWQELKTALAQLSPEASLEQHAHLRNDVRMMITHVGDMSNLILDPDLDSYYLMDATLLALPQTEDRLAAVIAYGETALKQPAISSPQQRQLAIHATSLKESDLDRIASSMQTALNEDENFYGRSASLQSRVPSLLKEYAAAAESFINLTTRLADPEKPDASVEEYLAAGNKAREASFKLWKVADEELDTLLQKRIQFYEHKRAKSLLVAALALLAAVSFVTFITRSISGPLRKQAADMMTANQALQAEMAERTRAEMELRHSEAQLAAAQKIARIGSWAWDVPSDKMTWSEENHRIHGLKPGEFRGSYEASLAFVHPEERGPSDVVIQRTLQDGSPFSFEQRIVRPDGTERIIHQCGEIIRGSAGEVARMFGTAQDVTERKQAEKELEKVHQQLLETSRQAGMAEVATGVLHNVGNVLNSVNVTTTLLSSRLRKSKASYVGQVATLMQNHSSDLGEFMTRNPKGQRLPAYLGELSGSLAVEQATALEELDGLHKNIEHIKDIVAMQQNFAKVCGVTEIVKTTELVEDALRMNASSLARHDVQVFRDFGVHPPEINVEKHKVLQILVNLVRNAKGACDESGRADKRVTVRVANGDGRVKISVMDNGIGIPPENLTRIFNHGFTTKKDGHGFGLHSGALSAKEMGGALLVRSDGTGHGATFTLDLPLQPSSNIL